MIYSVVISGTDWLEVSIIYKAYFSGLCKRISPQNMALYDLIWYSTSFLGSWISYWFMVRKKRTSYWGESKPTNITWPGPHIVQDGAPQLCLLV